MRCFAWPRFLHERHYFTGTGETDVCLERREVLLSGRLEHQDVRLLQREQRMLLFWINQEVEQLAAAQAALHGGLEGALARPGVVILIGLIVDQQLELRDADTHERLSRPVAAFAGRLFLRRSGDRRLEVRFRGERLGQQRVIGRVRSAFGRGDLLRARDRRAGTFQERADGFGFAGRVVRCSELGEAGLRSLGAAKSTCLSRASVTVRFPAAMSPSPSFSLR